MKKVINLAALATTGMAVSGAAQAAVCTPILVQQVPVDSPWALGTLAALLAVVVARALKNR